MCRTRLPVHGLAALGAAVCALASPPTARAQNACPCNWNDDLDLTSDDFFAFLADFANGNGDFNADGATTSDDFFAFLTCFFNGCPPVVPLLAGTDLFQSSGTLTLSLPADFFGPGSEPFEGVVALAGVAPGTGGAFETGTTDFVLMRFEHAALHGVPSEALDIALELVQLALMSVKPITVAVGGGGGGEMQMWDVALALGPHADTDGLLDLQRTGEEEGTFTLDVPANLIATFTRLGGGGGGGGETRTLDLTGLLLTGGGAWGPALGCPSAPLEIPGFLGLGPCFLPFTLTSGALTLNLQPPVPDPDRPPPIILPGAIVDPGVASLGRSAVISAGAMIGPGAVIGPSAFIGPGASIGAGALVGGGASIGADTVLEPGAIACDNSTVGANCTIGERAVVSVETVIGDNVQIGSNARLEFGTSIGDGATVGGKARLEQGVTIGEGATVADGLFLFRGAVVPPFTVQTLPLLQCTLPDGTETVTTPGACEADGGWVFGLVDGAAGVTSPTPVPGVNVQPIPFDPANPPAGLENLQRDVRNAGMADAAGRIIDRAWVAGTYTCGDFARDMEIALQALGYDATWTYLICWTPNPAHTRWNWVWTPGNMYTGAHAVTDVHLNNRTIWIEPQNGQVGINMDNNGDGMVTYATGPGRRLTDGTKRIELYASAETARNAGRDPGTH